MRCFRLRLTQTSGGSAPWHSDTLWGQLCWIYRDLNGEEALNGLLQEALGGNVPFVVSDGFPAGFLPIPVGVGIEMEPDATLTKEQGISQMESNKRLKRQRYITEAQFINVIQGQPLLFDKTVAPPDDAFAVQSHNSIDRYSNTVMADGGLYQKIWRIVGNGKLDIYVLVREDFSDPMKECFTFMQRQGFGGKLSIGMGAFEINEWIPYDFPNVADHNCFVTLSHCTPSSDMPVNAHYKLRIKYGKLGHDRSRQGEPFKKPVIQFEPGAVFFGSPPIGGYCGCLVEGAAFDYADTVQCGLSIAVPAKIQAAL